MCANEHVMRKFLIALLGSSLEIWFRISTGRSKRKRAILAGTSGSEDADIWKEVDCSRVREGC
jgi:hypothetical protein